MTPRKGHPDGRLALLGVAIAVVIVLAMVFTVFAIARSGGAS